MDIVTKKRLDNAVAAASIMFWVAWTFTGCVLIYFFWEYHALIFFMAVTFWVMAVNAACNSRDVHKRYYQQQEKV